MDSQKLALAPWRMKAKPYLIDFPQAKQWSGPFRTGYEGSKATSASTTPSLAPPPSSTFRRQNPFNKFPLEINQRIALFVEYDKDLCSLRETCRAANDTIDADNCSFWRMRFLAHFDKPPKALTNQEYRKAYQERRHVLKNGAAFHDGSTGRESICLEKLMVLIRETYSEEVSESNNVATIKKFLIGSNMVPLFRVDLHSPSEYRVTRRSSRGINWEKEREKLRKVYYRDLMCAFQVMCAPVLLSLERGLTTEVLGFQRSQILAYCSEIKLVNMSRQPMEVDITGVLHQINFWRYHLCRSTEHTLFPAFADLSPQQRPQFWKSKLKQGVTGLGKHWKSSYAYLSIDDIESLTLADETTPILDSFPGESTTHAFQDLTVSMVDDEKEIYWPDAFAMLFPEAKDPLPTDMLRTRSSAAKISKDRPRPFQISSPNFKLSDVDSDDIMQASGWIKEVPPQHNIVGWQQINMMKYCMYPDGTIDPHNLWTYDGLVLPGGQIIVGRWCAAWQSAGEVPFCGPFIMWCVDGAQKSMVD